jgi:hypothetical protein
MSIANTIVIFALLALAYLATPVMLVLGWRRWSMRANASTPSSISSLAGLTLASMSALLGFATLVYARFHHFGYYDPILMRIYRWGAVLSCGAVLFSFAGAWGRNAIRWYAPACAIGTLSFWIMAGASE